MTELKNTMYEDADLRDIIAEVEGYEAEIETMMASARGKAAGVKKKIKATKKRAKDLSIPMGILIPLLKVRKLERQQQKIVGDVAEDLIEVFEDAAGQFSMFAPEGDEPVVDEPTVKRAAKKAAAKAKANQEAEQAEGGKILDELVH